MPVLRGKHLPFGIQFNQLDWRTLPAGTQLVEQVRFGLIQLRPFASRNRFSAVKRPYLCTRVRASGYLHAATAITLCPAGRLEKRFSSGGALAAAYTFSKILVNVETQTAGFSRQTGN
jgi:hypothetical protein